MDSLPTTNHEKCIHIGRGLGFGEGYGFGLKFWA